MNINNKKYILYLDESGCSSLTDYVSKKFLLTGVMIDRKEDIEISAYFNFIKRKYNIPINHPFHSYDIFDNKRSSSYLTNANAKAVTSSLAEFIDITPIKFKVFMLDKNKLRRFFGFKKDSFKGIPRGRRKDKEIGYDILASRLIFWFARELEKKSAKGEVVADSRRKSDIILLDAYLNCQTPSNFNKSDIITLSEEAHNNITSIKFEKKTGLCGGLEIADLISYVSFLAENNKLKKFDTKNIPILWKIIKKNMLRKAIQEIKEENFEKYLTIGRVNRMANHY